jgi:hypothetical protein
MGIPPVIDLDRKLVMTRAQDRIFVGAFLLGLPSFFLGFGLVVWRVRRR